MTEKPSPCTTTTTDKKGEDEESAPKKKDNTIEGILKHPDCSGDAKKKREIFRPSSTPVDGRHNNKKFQTHDPYILQHQQTQPSCYVDPGGLMIPIQVNSVGWTPQMNVQQQHQQPVYYIPPEMYGGTIIPPSSQQQQQQQQQNSDYFDGTPGLNNSLEGEVENITPLQPQPGDYQDMVPTEYYLRVIEAFKDSMVEVADVCRSVNRSNEMYASKMCKLMESWMEDPPAMQSSPLSSPPTTFHADRSSFSSHRNQQWNNKRTESVTDTAIQQKMKNHCATVFKPNYNAQHSRYQQTTERTREEEEEEGAEEVVLQQQQQQQQKQLSVVHSKTNATELEKKEIYSGYWVDFRNSISILQENKKLFEAYSVLATEATTPLKGNKIDDTMSHDSKTTSSVSSGACDQNKFQMVNNKETMKSNGVTSTPPTSSSSSSGKGEGEGEENWGELSAAMISTNPVTMHCCDNNKQQESQRYDIFSWKTRPVFDIETEEAVFKSSLVRKRMSNGTDPVTITEAAKILEKNTPTKTPRLDAARCLIWLAMNGIITCTNGNWTELKHLV